MEISKKPLIRPSRPFFSSGPCVKNPTWSLSKLESNFMARSHRSAYGQERLSKAIRLTKELLEVPDDYLVAMVPASATGAVETALWSLLGPRGVDILCWDHFGKEWGQDITEQLKLTSYRIISADYGHLPDLSTVNFDNDVVFTWNATSSGVKVPNADFIPDDRAGLTICDATSAAFGQALDFSKLDVITYSWQKLLGGEGSNGMLILSPRAVERLESYTPSWGLPKIFRLTENGKLIKKYFEGYTINTPSLLCVEDYIMALEWGLSIGGLSALIDRCNKNAEVIWKFIESSEWLENLAKEPESYSNTSVCMHIVDPRFTSLSQDKAKLFMENIFNCLEEEKAAFDINSYRTAPLGFRIWCGATVEKEDLEKLTPWLTWAFKQEISKIS